MNTFPYQIARLATIWAVDEVSWSGFAALHARAASTIWAQRSVSGGWSSGRDLRGRPGLCSRTESTHPRPRRCRGPNGSPLRAVVQKLSHRSSMATKCAALWPYLAFSHLLRD